MSRLWLEGNPVSLRYYLHIVFGQEQTLLKFFSLLRKKLATP